MRLLHSLSFRLALTYVALFCTSVAVLLGLYYWVNIERPLTATKAQVNAEFRTMLDIHAVQGDAALVAALERRAAQPGAPKPFHAFINPGGRPITSNLPSWPREVSNNWVSIEADLYSEGDEIDFRALARDVRLPDGHRLLVGRDADDIGRRRDMIGAAAIWMLLGTLVLGIVGGMLMSRAIHARIEAVNRAALRVIEGDLSGRVAVRGTGDDFDRLGETLNLMLARIEDLFEAVRRVSDSVAHELRTPLTRLLVQLERLDSVDDPDAKQAFTDAAVAEVRRLHAIFDALLRISRIETGRHHAASRSIDIPTLIDAVAEYHAPDAERRGIALEISAPPGVAARGDPDLLFQALSNLIDNALKYTPAGGSVIVGARGEGRMLTLFVADDGPGIAAADAGRVTERFYRGAETGGAPGEGLGLSLVAAIAAQHHASLTFRDNAPGLRVEITLPG